MKQETLQEASERLTYNDALSWENTLAIESFKLGAKWQQETIYNQIKELYDNENITGFSKLAFAKCLDIVDQFKNK